MHSLQKTDHPGVIPYPRNIMEWSAEIYDPIFRAIAPPETNFKVSATVTSQISERTM